MADSPPCFHVELKSFPHVARAFNLDRATLERRFLTPFVAGEMIDYDDRRWAADKTKLTVVEGEALGDAACGLGRGWGEVTRHGRDVTDAVLAVVQRGAGARPEVEALQHAIAEVASGADGIALADAVALAVAAHPGWRASDQLSLAEQAVWELLHRRLLEMLDSAGTAVAPERWEQTILSWAQWAGDGDPARVRALASDAD